MDGQRHSDGRSTPTVRRRWRRVTSLMAVVLVAASLSSGRAVGQTTSTTGPSASQPLPFPLPAVDPAAGGTVQPPTLPIVTPSVGALGQPPASLAAKPGAELVERRTATSKTFVGDEPGQLRTELYDAPVHFKDPQGRWTEIDDLLGASTDGRRRNGANAFGLSIADSAADKALARLAVDTTHSVGFALEGAADVKGNADARSVTYAKVRHDTDVRLTSRRTGVKEELILASPAAPDRFVFPLELKGLTASLNQFGDVVYRDESGAERGPGPLTAS